MPSLNKRHLCNKKIGCTESTAFSIEDIGLKQRQRRFAVALNYVGWLFSATLGALTVLLSRLRDLVVFGKPALVSLNEVVAERVTHQRVADNVFCEYSASSAHKCDFSHKLCPPCVNFQKSVDFFVFLDYNTII